MAMKDKHKPLAQAVSQASPVLWPLEHPLPFTLHLDNSYSSFRPQLVAVRIYVRKKNQTSPVCVFKA